MFFELLSFWVCDWRDFGLSLFTIGRSDEEKGRYGARGLFAINIDIRDLSYCWCYIFFIRISIGDENVLS